LRCNVAWVNAAFERLNTVSAYFLAVVLSLTSNRQVRKGETVWVGKPWIAPAAIIRTVTVIVTAIIILILEYYFNSFSVYFVGLPLWVWTTLAFFVIWLIRILDLAIYRMSNVYILRQDGLETRRGIIRLHSFVVTPAGFGDLLVYQSVGGRIFGYGELTVNSQGGRQTKLVLVRDPFAVADTIREVMSKLIVRVDTHT